MIKGQRSLYVWHNRENALVINFMTIFFPFTYTNYIVQCPIECLSHHTIQTFILFILWNHIICAYKCFSFSYITYKNKWQKSKILMPKGFFYCVTYSWNIFIEWICTVLPITNKFQINAILYKLSINIIYHILDGYFDF